MSTRRILFCSSEAYPLIKTGGLADVAGSLPRALLQEGHDVRLLLPGYQDIWSALTHKPRRCLDFMLEGYPVTLWQSTLPGSRVGVWLVDCPPLFDRPGNPYHDVDGEPWPDNAQRFDLFCRVAARLCSKDSGMDWRPDIVHSNDWQCGLIPVHLQNISARPATVFTIHNLAYQGIFDRATFESLGLPEDLWHYTALEYHGQFAFIKGGLVYADYLTTVSPTYAQEIQTPAFGHGMEGVLSHRAARLRGILNGIDTRTWNPGTDRLIAQRYNRQRLSDKAANKTALQKHFKLTLSDTALVIGMVSRLAEQKGFDLVLESLKQLLALPVQLVVLGSGDRSYQKALLEAAKEWPHQVGVQIGYDEQLAHRIEAGVDLFLMPSRFEPCGLNQMYSQRYGTLPVVTPIGGLADTVIDASGAALERGEASGFVMQQTDGAAMLKAIQRAVACYAQPEQWRALQRFAMSRDFSWQKSAQAYTQLYEQALSGRPPAP
ncbi:MAG: glycogen synthase GlgA [Thiohalophilus sp.]|jgi:starch synthase